MKVASILVLAMLFSLPAYAGMSGYSGYFTVSADLTHVYVTGVVEGNGINIPVGGVTHQGTCSVSVAGVKTTIVGYKQPAASYMNISCTATITPPDPMPDDWSLNVESQQQVQCSLAGLIFFLQEGPSAIGHRLSAYTIATTVGTCLYNRSCIGTCSDPQIQRGKGPLCAKFLQCIDIVYTCLCGGPTECFIKRLYCSKETKVGICTENRPPRIFLDALRL